MGGTFRTGAAEGLCLLREHEVQLSINLCKLRNEVVPSDVQNFLGCLSLCLSSTSSKWRQEWGELLGFWPNSRNTLNSSNHRSPVALGPYSAWMKGQAKPRGHGGTLNQINQTSWETPFAPNVTFELPDREEKGRRSSLGLWNDSCSPIGGGAEDQLLQSISWSQGGEKAGKNPTGSREMEKGEFREG